MEGSLKCTYLQLRVTIQTPHKPGGAPFTVLKAYNGNCRIESSAWTFNKWTSWSKQSVFWTKHMSSYKHHTMYVCKQVCINIVLGWIDWSTNHWTPSCDSLQYSTVWESPSNEESHTPTYIKQSKAYFCMDTADIWSWNHHTKTKLNISTVQYLNWSLAVMVTMTWQEREFVPSAQCWRLVVVITGFYANQVSYTEPWP